MNLLNPQNKVGIIILAAGKGKRMKSELPKVMHLLKGKPLIEYLVGTVESLNLGIKPVVVVSGENNLVQDHLGDRADYAIQAERRGTGHAVSMAEPNLQGKVKSIVVLYGDMPFVSAVAVGKLIAEHAKNSGKVTMMTTTVPDFNDWRAGLLDYGRVIRGVDGRILKIAEFKDATEEEKSIKEINSGSFCFDTGWLWESLSKLKNENAQGEYYLTDLIQMAVEEGAVVSSVAVDPKEAVGINTKEQLEIANKI